MSIYNIAGSPQYSAYDIQGNPLNNAYNRWGDIVFSADPYQFYSISSVFNKERNSAQGMDIYGKYMAIYRDDTHAVQIVNMETWEIEYTISTDWTTHGNDLSFSTLFYSENDPLPILFISGNAATGIRINLNDQSSAIVKTIHATPSQTGWTTYATAFNDDMSRYYRMGYNTSDYTDTSGFIFLETWDISEDLEYPTLLDAVTREWLPCIQGMSYHDGLLWVASGMNDPVKVYSIDPSDASIVKTVNLTRTGELEGIAWAYNENTDEYSCIYGQIYNGITYYRIIFSPTPI